MHLVSIPCLTLPLAWNEFLRDQKFKACQQNLLAAIQQNEDSERALQQNVSKLNETIQVMAGKDERFVVCVCNLQFLNLFISFERMIRKSQQELADFQVITLSLQPFLLFMTK